MRGAWLVLCALSLARAGVKTPATVDPVLNAQWLEGFRRDLLRDAYDYETDPNPSSSLLSSPRSVVFTHAPENTSDSSQQAASDKPLGPPLDTSRRPPARRALDAASAGPDRPLARYAVRHTSVGYSSGKPPARYPLDDISDGHTSDRSALALDALDAPSADRSSARPNHAMVRYSTGKLDRPLDAPDAPLNDAASRELGISRRDLYGGRGFISDVELDAKRRPFLESLAQFDEQMRPVMVRVDPEAGRRPADGSDSRQRRGRKSRKRLWDQNSEQNQDAPPYIIDQIGVKRYKVHTDPRERFRNQFGSEVEPLFKEEWGIGESDDRNGSNEDSESRSAGDENVAQNEDRYQESREDSTQDERYGESRELDVSEYQQQSLRSRYVQAARPAAAAGADYARRFSARRDAALLADGLASSAKLCNCTTDTSQIVPEL